MLFIPLVVDVLKVFLFFLKVLCNFQIKIFLKIHKLIHISKIYDEIECVFNLESWI